MQIILAALFMFSTALMADVAEKPTSLDMGYTTAELSALQKSREAEVDVEMIKRNVSDAFEAQDLLAAVYSDQAMGAIMSHAVNVLKYYGYAKKAERIGYEYERFYKTAFTDKFLGAKEIGDHEPLNEWVKQVHEDIEAEIGEYLCNFLHLHDMFILNYGVPVTMHPELYALNEYNDHFAGHIKEGRKWVFKHHGVAGVVTYWGVNIACSVGTAGMGMVSFVCGPMSTAAEVGMDKFIAPPLGEKIWTKANGSVE